MTIQVRPASLEEKDVVNAFAKRYPAIKDFVFAWERWGNWTTNPPFIAMRDVEIVGFHAATLARRGVYVNSYFLATSESVRGQGVAGKLVEAALLAGRARGLTRLKMKCHFDSPGVQFWEGFGVKRFGQDAVQYWYDVDISNVGSIEDFIEWLRHPQFHAPPPEAALVALAKAGGQRL